jgi:hypothetical protein
MASIFDADATLKSVLEYCRIPTAIIDKAGIRYNPDTNLPTQLAAKNTGHF